MMRFSRASARSLRALLVAAALATPLTLASTAAADHDRGYRQVQRIGSLRLDGRLYTITDGQPVAEQIAAAFCRRGYRATVDCDTIVVHFDYGCRPRFSWSGCDFRVSQQWKGDCLILEVGQRRQYQRPARPSWECSTGPRVTYGTISPSDFRYGRSTSRGGEQSGGVYFSPRIHTSVVTVRGGYRDDPDWGRRNGQYPRYDHGPTRSWDRSCDTGFDVRYNWKSRRR